MRKTTNVGLLLWTGLDWHYQTTRGLPMFRVGLREWSGSGIGIIFWQPGPLTSSLPDRVLFWKKPLLLLILLFSWTTIVPNMGTCVLYKIRKGKLAKPLGLFRQ